jgi:hypothetical protein
VPPLAGRSAELDRIIAEYADDAIAELAVPPSSFTADAHAWVRDHAASSLARSIIDWYNDEHYHTGLALLHPVDVHYGRADAIVAARQRVLDDAHRRHPERFVRGLPTQKKDLLGWPALHVRGERHRAGDVVRQSRRASRQ